MTQEHVLSGEEQMGCCTDEALRRDTYRDKEGENNNFLKQQAKVKKQENRVLQASI